MRINVRLSSFPIAVALVATAGLRAAAAQTVIVQSAPPGSTIELTMNGGQPVSATADTDGDATLLVPAATSDRLVQMRVDTCGNVVRILLVERGVPPSAPGPGCNRSEIGSVFEMRPVTTFVVDIDGPNASVHLRQGPPPIGWLRRGLVQSRRSRPWGTPTRGLVLSAGAGVSSFGNAVDVACGDAQACRGSSYSGAISLGIDYWITRFFAAGVGYVAPGDVTAAGSGAAFNFDSRLETRLLTVAGKGGVPLGPARLYGFAGANRHQATSTTTETIADATVVVDGVTQTLKGGTQTVAQKTQGWAWLVGGGVEGWLTRRVAIYGEFTRAKIKGAPIAGGEGGIDDQATVIVGGARLRLGR
jgi:hypothetical protein